jgi:hypothetical protein
VRAKSPLWDELKADIVRLTAARGMRAALARELGVSRQVLNGWLFGVSAPGAEQTLFLHQWAGGRKRELKSPGTASTAPERKVQRREVIREENTPPPNRRKK